MSYSPSQPSPAPPLSRASMVIGLYGAMTLVALVIAAGRGDPDLYRFASEPRWLLAGARYLHTSFHDLLGPLTGREIMILALGSAIGEELLFRGALLPWLGPWWQAVGFALLHVGPGKRFLPWTASALVMGVVFGWLAVRTTNLGAPIAAHFTINFLNLRFIATGPAVLLRGTPPA